MIWICKTAVWVPIGDKSSGSNPPVPLPRDINANLGTSCHSCKAGAGALLLACSDELLQRDRNGHIHDCQGLAGNTKSVFQSRGQALLTVLRRCVWLHETLSGDQRSRNEGDLHGAEIWCQVGELAGLEGFTHTHTQRSGILINRIIVMYFVQWNNCEHKGFSLLNIY